MLPYFHLSEPTCVQGVTELKNSAFTCRSIIINLMNVSTVKSLVIKPYLHRIGFHKKKFWIVNSINQINYEHFSQRII